MHAFTNEAIEGPRLFSLVPVESNKFDPNSWTHHSFKLTLWCEHSRLPLPIIHEFTEEKDLPHVWPIFHNILPEARQTLDALATWIKRQLPGQAGS